MESRGGLKSTGNLFEFRMRVIREEGAAAVVVAERRWFRHNHLRASIRSNFCLRNSTGSMIGYLRFGDNLQGLLHHWPPTASCRARNRSTIQMSANRVQFRAGTKLSIHFPFLLQFPRKLAPVTTSWFFSLIDEYTFAGGRNQREWRARRGCTDAIGRLGRGIFPGRGARNRIRRPPGAANRAR